MRHQPCLLEESEPTRISLQGRQIYVCQGSREKLKEVSPTRCLFYCDTQSLLFYLFLDGCLLSTCRSAVAPH